MNTTMPGDWRKSTHSNPNGACVEAATRWRKASYSNSQGACVETASWRKSTRSDYGSSIACVEAGHGPGVVGVRDSQLGRASLVLEFSPAAWARFTASLR